MWWMTAGLMAKGRHQWLRTPAKRARVGFERADVEPNPCGRLGSHSADQHGHIHSAACSRPHGAWVQRAAVRASDERRALAVRHRAKRDKRERVERAGAGPRAASCVPYAYLLRSKPYIHPEQGGLCAAVIALTGKKLGLGGPGLDRSSM